MERSAIFYVLPVAAGATHAYRRPCIRYTSGAVEREDSRHNVGTFDCMSGTMARLQRRSLGIDDMGVEWFSWETK